MRLKSLALSAAVVIVSGIASLANAATFPTFVFDSASSDITLTKKLDLCLGCGLTASFHSDAVNLAPWTATSANDSLRVNNFIDWTVGKGFGGEKYDVSVTLAFSSPDPSAGSTTGSAIVGTIGGVISGGVLTWKDSGIINFSQGSQLTFALDPTIALGLGNSTTTGVTFTGSPIAPRSDTVAPVPLPAGGLLLIGALGGLTVLRRKSRA